MTKPLCFVLGFVAGALVLPAVATMGNAISQEIARRKPEGKRVAS